MNQLYLGNKTDIDLLFDLLESNKTSDAVTPIKVQDYLKMIRYSEEEISLKKALEIANQAISQHKFSSKLHASKAHLLIAINNAELALESLDRAEMFGQCFIKTDLLRVKAHILLKNYARAIEIIYDLRVNYQLKEEDIVHSYVMEAQVYKAQKNYDQMYNTLKTALQLNINNELALKDIWLAMEMSQQYEDCIDFHHDMLEKDAYQHLAWFNLGHAYYSIYDWDNALEAFEYAIVNNEEYQPAYHYYVEVAMLRQKYFLAINCIENARTHFDLDEDMLFNLAVCHQKVHLYEKARNYYFRALKLDNSNPDIYYHLGCCYAAEGRHQDALYYFRKAIEINNQHEDYQQAIAESYNALELTNKAMIHFKAATEIAPDRNDIWTKQAISLLKNQQVHEALQLLKEADQFTYGADLCYCKAACWFLLNKTSQYLRDLEEGLIEDYAMRSLFFSLIPKERHQEQELKGIIRYYEYPITP